MKRLPDALNIVSPSKIRRRRCDEHRPGPSTHGVAKPDLVLLDIMLPDVPGSTTARTLRFERTPVIMVTARSSEVDVVLGLEIGAAD